MGSWYKLYDFYILGIILLAYCIINYLGSDRHSFTHHSYSKFNDLQWRSRRKHISSYINLELFVGIYWFFLMICNLLVTYAWSNWSIYSGSSSHWLFIYFLCWGGVLILGLWQNSADIQGSRSEWVWGFISFSFILCLYIATHNLLVLIFLIETQGMLLLYIFSCGDNTHKMLVNIVLTQYWVGFIAALVLIFYLLSCARWGGCIYYWDLGILAQSKSWQPYLTTFAFSSWIIFIALGLKLGAAPLYFWKPEIYRNISLRTMLYYAVYYTGALVSVFSYLVLILVSYNNNLSNLFLYMCGFSALLTLSTLSSFTELRIFLAYISIFHISSIICIWVCGISGGALISLYTCAYFSLLGSFILLLIRSSKLTITYLTEIFRGRGGCVGMLVLLWASLGGVPPFPVFWLKLGVMSTLWSYNYGGLAIWQLVCGIIIIYFYGQLYRWSSSSNIIYIYGSSIYNSLLAILCILIYLGIFFLADLLNILGCGINFILF